MEGAFSAASAASTASAASAASAETGGNKRKRTGDAAFADAKADVFDAKMRKRMADEALRRGDGDAAAVEKADAALGKCVEKAALIAAFISNKAVEKAARSALCVIGDLMEHFDDAEFKQTKQTLSYNRKAAKSLAEAQAAAGAAVDHAGKAGGSMMLAFPFFEMPIFHVRRVE